MTRKFIKPLVVATGLISAFGAAHASDVIGIRVKLGYHFSQNFELKDGSKGNLEGPEIAADFPLYKFPGIQIFATPSVMFGGKLAHGADIDGQVYRFMLTARQTLNKDNLYGAFSAGVAHSESRGLDKFRSADGLVSSVSLGVPLKFKILGITPNVEGSYYFSTKDQFRGFTIGLSASF